MIDLHYDLLSILYYSYKKNDFRYVEKLQKYYEKNNISAVVCNLYFMSEEEMKEEMQELYEPIDVVERFKISTMLFSKYFPKLKALYSIEGCDYISSTQELEELYRLGLRNILLVWNNPNCYGSGNRSHLGLSELGKKFLIKAIELGISIDLSHMNRETFSDTVLLLKEEKAKGKEVKVIVSHSNSYSIYEHARNLTDEQLLSIQEFQPVVGLVSYAPFVSSSKDIEVGRKKYLEHILHVKDLLGIDAVAVSTDSMQFCVLFKSDTVLSDAPLFDYSSVGVELKELLRSVLTEEEVEKVLYQNSYLKLFEERV